MRKAATLFALFILSGCGIDGEPSQPVSPSSAVTISGEASIGVVGRL